MKTVYVDEVFFVNFIVDYLILYLSSIFLHINVNLIRKFFSAFFGALYSVLIVILSPNLSVRILAQTVSLILMSILCFGERSIRTYARIVFSLLLFSILLGGVVMLVSSNLNLMSSAIIIIICSILLVIISYFGIKFFRNDVSKKVVEVVIEKYGRRHKCSLLCDSGNLLVDPYNSLPIILLDNKCKEIVVGNNNYYYETGIRLVPIKTASGDYLAEVFTPDEVIICGIKNQKVNASVGFMSSEMTDRERCVGIIPSILVDNL